MKKTLNIMLSLLIIVSFSLNVSSQSDQKDLDQVKLLKQMLGSWETEIGRDTFVIAEAVPSGKGIIAHIEWKARGETFESMVSIMGFTEDYKTVVFYGLWGNGVVSKDIGRFVSPTKLMMERYYADQYQAKALSEIEFQTPETYTWNFMWRGKEIAWEPLWANNWTWTRVKE